jgi:hypothetical protein
MLIPKIGSVILKCRYNRAQILAQLVFPHHLIANIMKTKDAKLSIINCFIKYPKTYISRDIFPLSLCIAEKVLPN